MCLLRRGNDPKWPLDPSGHPLTYFPKEQVDFRLYNTVRKEIKVIITVSIPLNEKKKKFGHCAKMHSCLYADFPNIKELISFS